MHWARDIFRGNFKNPQYNSTGKASDAKYGNYPAPLARKLSAFNSRGGNILSQSCGSTEVSAQLRSATVSNVVKAARTSYVTRSDAQHVYQNTI